MQNLLEVVHYAIKGAVNDGVQHVAIIEKEGGRTQSRKIYQKYFSNWPVEYVRFKGKRYQVNTVKELYPT